MKRKKNNNIYVKGSGGDENKKNSIYIDGSGEIKR